MKAAPFDYDRPASVLEALGLLAGRPGARLLAGGQSLVPAMNFRTTEPTHLIDINRLSELDHITDEGTHVSIGAMTRQRTVELSPLVAERLPLVTAAVKRLGHRQTRNRGTVGGSLCHLDPSAELALVACIHEGQLDLRSMRGRRTLAMHDFAIGAHVSALAADEMLVALRLTPWPASHGFGLHEFSRRHADWAIATAAALMVVGGSGRIERIAIAIGAIEAFPRRLPGLERQLLGHRPLQALFDAAAATVANEGIAARDDVNAPGWYRTHLARVLITRALGDAARRALLTSGRHA